MADDPLCTLCYHVLLAAAQTAGRAPGGGARERALSRELATMVAATRRADAFVASLGEICDDVTLMSLVTPRIASSDHSVCYLLSDMFAAWMDEPLDRPDNNAYAAWAAAKMHVKIALSSDTPASVADVLTYAAPLAAVCVADPAGTYPVCTDTFAATLFKKITLLLRVAYHHAEYAQQAVAIEAAIHQRLCTEDDAACWQAICAAASPVVWACLKSDATVLLEMCANAQADAGTWRARVLEPTYTELDIPRLNGGGVSEEIENEYLSVALSEFIATRYGAQKIMNPTTLQMVPFVRLLAIQARACRGYNLFMGARDAPCTDWTAMEQVPPHTMRDMVALAGGRGVIIQDAKRQRTFAFGAAPNGAGFIVDGDGEPVIASDAATLDYDAFVTSRKCGALWRASVLGIAPPDAARERAECLRELLGTAGVGWHDSPSKRVNCGEDTHF